MNKQKIKIIGNGGCLNRGLPYNSFILNDDFLIESPPDIMPSIQKLGIDIGKINILFISHLHGDHTFGLPFIIINKWINIIKTKSDNRLTIYGPENIDNHTLELLEYAFSKNHPCFKWAAENINFNIIDEKSKIAYNDLELSFFELEHIRCTYGFRIREKGKNIFSYIADTRWCKKIEEVLMENPKIALIDMNGGNPDVHVSRKEVFEKGLAITGKNTVYYGTHLFEEFKSESEFIFCARQGDEFEI